MKREINGQMVVFTNTAVEEFCHVVGFDSVDEGRAAMVREFEGAHFVKRMGSGAELWRGKRPRRLLFIVHVTGKAELTIGRVLAEHRDARTARPRRVRIIAKSPSGMDVETELDVTFTALEPGGRRRIAYQLPDGRWAEGVRGTRVGEVDGFRIVGDRPEWAKNLGG